MRLLFIHPNFPGQYKNILSHLAKDNTNEIIFLCRYKNQIEIPGIKKIHYEVTRKPYPETHFYLINLEKAVFEGQEVWRVCKKLKEQNFIPDIIIAHPGWGSALFVKDVFINTPLLNFCEFFYHAFGADVHFDPSEKILDNNIARIKLKNSNHLINLVYCDQGVTPTKWQYSTFPKEFQSKISIIHDGINTKLIKKPQFPKKIQFADGTILGPKDEIITNVERGFEPQRGFPTIIKAIYKILKERPNCHAIMVGGDEVSYGKRHESGKPYRTIMMEELHDIPRDRIHFVGTVAYSQLLEIFYLSTVHIYMTKPFVLSWSMLESMAAQCTLIASSTAPVQEFVKDEYNGFLVDFFDVDALANKINYVLDHRNEMKEIQHNARNTIIQTCDLEKMLPLHLNLIKNVIENHDSTNMQNFLLKPDNTCLV